MGQRSTIFTPVLIVGCAIIMVSFAIRASFGVFQIPIAEEFGWLRAEFSLAIAIQNLAWGVGQPIFGAVAEKVGDRKAIVIGAATYALGMVLSANGSPRLNIRPMPGWWVLGLRALALASFWPLSVVRPATKTGRCRWLLQRLRAVRVRYLVHLWRNGC